MADNTCVVVKFKGYLKFIDLGLPSGTKWAAYNVGAKSPYEAGYYFSWGNVGGHYAGDGYSFTDANYNASAGAALTGDIPANTTYDMAMANFGTDAKLPTEDQYDELASNCTSEWTTINGVSGLRLTSKINGNFIFMPASGHWVGTNMYQDGSRGLYFSSTRNTDAKAVSFDFDSSSVNAHNHSNKSAGFVVRAVKV